MGRVVVLLAVLAACGDSTTAHDGGTPPPSVVEVPASLTLVEGEEAQLVIKLAHDPLQDVTIDVTSVDISTASITTSSVTLSSASYEAGEAVTVVGSEDDDDVVNDTTEIDLSIDDEVVARVATTVLDNDVQQIVIDPPSLTIGESAAGTFEVRLARQPAGLVTATLWSTAEQVVQIDRTSLTFGPTDYAVPQTVTVSAPADDDTSDGTAAIVVGQVAETATQQVAVEVTDDDVQALLIDSTTVPVTEGASGTFTVALAFDPQTPVTLQLEPSDPGAVWLPASAVTFDSSNYDIPRTVTVFGIEDVDTANEMVTVHVSGASAGDVTVPVTDNDDIIVGATQNVLCEGCIASFSVRLANDPGPSGRTVDLDVMSGDLVPQVSSFTFTSADYATSQQVVVYAPVDASSTTDITSVVRVSYPGQTPRDVSFTILNRLGAGTLSALSLQHETRITGAVGWMEVRFTIDSILPGDGRVAIDLPSELDVSTATLLSSTLDGSLSLTTTPSGLALARSAGTTIYRGTAVTVRIGNVGNPAEPGDYPITVTTETSSGDALDTGTVTDSLGSGPLLNAVVTFSTLEPGATGNVTISFTTTNAWPADGALEIYFPLEFDVSGATVVSQTGLDGTLAAAVPVASHVSVTRSGGTLLPGGSSVSITIGNITNPAAAQATTFFELVTELATGRWIDLGFPDGVTIGCPATITRSPHETYGAALGGDAWYVWSEGTGYIAKLESSDWLVHHDFRFMIPVGATIVGIRFDVSRESTGWPVIDSAVRAVKATIGQTDRSSTAQWQWSETAAYGGATDLWGDSWTAADIESSTFGLAMAAQATTPGMTGTVKVDGITATVYLSCP